MLYIVVNVYPKTKQEKRYRVSAIFLIQWNSSWAPTKNKRGEKTKNRGLAYTMMYDEMLAFIHQGYTKLEVIVNMKKWHKIE